MDAMEKEYGDKKGEKVFYASRNKGTIKGVEKDVKSHALKNKTRSCKKCGGNHHYASHHKKTYV